MTQGDEKVMRGEIKEDRNGHTGKSRNKKMYARTEKKKSSRTNKKKNCGVCETRTSCMLKIQGKEKQEFMSFICEYRLDNTAIFQRENAVHEFHETCHFITFYFMKKDSKRCCDTTTPESMHTKDESKRGSAFAFIFGVN